MALASGGRPAWKPNPVKSSVIEITSQWGSPGSYSPIKEVLELYGGKLPSLARGYKFQCKNDEGLQYVNGTVCNRSYAQLPSGDDTKCRNCKKPGHFEANVWAEATMYLPLKIVLVSETECTLTSLIPPSNWRTKNPQWQIRFISKEDQNSWIKTIMSMSQSELDIWTQLKENGWSRLKNDTKPGKFDYFLNGQHKESVHSEQGARDYDPSAPVTPRKRSQPDTPAVQDRPKKQHRSPSGFEYPWRKQSEEKSTPPFKPDEPLTFTVDVLVKVECTDFPKNDDLTNFCFDDHFGYRENVEMKRCNSTQYVTQYQTTERPCKFVEEGSGFYILEYTDNKINGNDGVLRELRSDETPERENVPVRLRDRIKRQAGVIGHLDNGAPIADS